MNEKVLNQITELYDRLESLNETIDCLKYEYRALSDIAEALEDVVKG